MSAQLAILGGGLLGQAVASLGAAAGIEVHVWARREEAREALRERFGAPAPKGKKRGGKSKTTGGGITVVDTVAKAADGATLVVLAVSASGLREVCAELGEVARGDTYVLHATRGACPGDGWVPPHQVVREETCVRKIGVIGGPLYAPDLSGDRPLAAVVASRFDETFEVVRALTASTPVRVHHSRDVIGVEVAGIMSSVAAIAAGAADALELGETARGVLLTRGLSEAARLGVALGGEAATFSGLAGVGDLIPRPVDSTQRHYALGAALAAGKTLREALDEVQGEVEGVYNAGAALAAAERLGVNLVLAGAVHAVCEGEQSAADALEDVLTRHLDLGRGLGM